MLQQLCAALRVPSDETLRWRAWIGLAYGDLGGQRGLDHGAFAARIGVSPEAHDATELVLAAHLCAGLHADRIAQSILPTASHAAPHGYIVALLSGEGRDALDALPTGLRCWSDIADVYRSLLPRNVRHTLGEFYTPPWLADLVLQRSGWSPGQRLIDPFAGPGVILCAALRRARALGADPLRVLPDLTGLDINPTACALARAAVLAELAPELTAAGATTLALDIRCVDAITEDAQAQASFMVTNPPWVGWEYQSRALRERVIPLWESHDLCYKGRHRAFLKEDLSTLATVVAIDRYLTDGGRAAVLLPAASLKSALASGGLRRLRVRDTPLQLAQIDLFDTMQVFSGAQVDTMAWTLRKGAETAFPVPVRRWVPRAARWKPAESASLGAVCAAVRVEQLGAMPSDRRVPRSRWMVGERALLAASARLRGEMPYRARSGVFTGGANAVYYVDRIECLSDEASRFRNVVGRARRAAPQVEAVIEESLVYRIVRGRDLVMWGLKGHGHILCPHTAESRMHAIPPEEMARRCPHALRYLTSMRAVLDARGGFAAWEKPFQREAFYTMQRIGAYTFSPHKVAWKYIDAGFTVAVLTPDDRGMPVLANDKVISIAVGSAAEAHYLAGVLSSAPVAWQVRAQTSGRQISTSAIDNLSVPPHNPEDPLHQEIAATCASGHALRRDDPTADIAALQGRVDLAVGRLFGIPAAAVARFQQAR